MSQVTVAMPRVCRSEILTPFSFHDLHVPQTKQIPHHQFITGGNRSVPPTAAATLVSLGIPKTGGARRRHVDSHRTIMDIRYHHHDKTKHAPSSLPANPVARHTRCTSSSAADCHDHSLSRDPVPPCVLPA